MQEVSLSLSFFALATVSVNQSSKGALATSLGPQTLYQVSSNAAQGAAVGTFRALVCLPGLLSTSGHEDSQMLRLLRPLLEPVA